MQNHRILSGLTIFLMVLLVAAGWFLFAQPQLASAAAANSQLAGVQSQITATEATITQLRGEQKDLPDLRAKLAALQTSIPSDVQSSDYIKGLNALAAASGVTITGITVDDSKEYTAPVSAAAPATTSSSTATASPTPTPSASPTASATPASSWTPATSPLITATNFVLIPVTVSTAGDWNTTLTFVNGLQTGTRLFLVSGLSFSHDAIHPEVLDATVTGYIYAIVDPNAAAVAASAATATATPTPPATPPATASPSSSATPTPTPSSTPTKKP